MKLGFHEPIWFNRFLYLPSDIRRGRILKKELERNLVSRGFNHLSDLLSSSTYYREVQVTVVINGKRLFSKRDLDGLAKLSYLLLD